MLRPRLVITLFLAALVTFAGCKKDVTVLHKPPTVHAGTSKTITLPDSAILSGSAQADSGSHVVAYLWSQVSGPGASTILDPGSDSTAVSFDVSGTYVFQLEATDDQGATGVDTVSILVNSGAKTLTLAPSNNPNEYSLILYNGGDESNISQQDLAVAAWTINSLPLTVRILEKFDWSSLPSYATILSANLYLYTYPPPLLNGNFQDANYGTNNTMLVQQVTSNWVPTAGTTTWFNQPSTTTTNQVVVPTTTLSQLDLNLDVTAQVKSMISNNANYGFEFKLQDETYYTSRIFVSTQNTTYTAKHPKLVITYR